MAKEKNQSIEVFLLWCKEPSCGMGHGDKSLAGIFCTADLANKWAGENPCHPSDHYEVQPFPLQMESTDPYVGRVVQWAMTRMQGREDGR